MLSELKFMFTQDYTQRFITTLSSSITGNIPMSFNRQMNKQLKTISIQLNTTQQHKGTNLSDAALGWTSKMWCSLKKASLKKLNTRWFHLVTFSKRQNVTTRADHDCQRTGVQRVWLQRDNSMRKVIGILERFCILLWSVVVPQI